MGKIFRGFRCLSKNGDDEPDKDERVFLTEKSMQRNLSRLFGYKNDFLASRLYNLMSGGIKDKRIFFPQYMNALDPLLNGGEPVKQKFMFKFYDIDNDGVLTGQDLV